MRASELIGSAVSDRDGRPLGRVVDLVTEEDEAGRLHVVEVLVNKRRTGRLPGYERSDRAGPWLLEAVVRLIHRGTRKLRWDEVRIDVSPD
jgi:sporulation protein YlmC with PRC-barrel domain